MGGWYNKAMKKYILFSLFILSPVSIYAACDCLVHPSTMCGSASDGWTTDMTLPGSSVVDCNAYMGNCYGTALVTSCIYFR